MFAKGKSFEEQGIENFFSIGKYVIWLKNDSFTGGVWKWGLEYRCIKGLMIPGRGNNGKHLGIRIETGMNLLHRNPGEGNNGKHFGMRVETP